VFRVPPRNPTFVGRAEDLAEFAGVFASGSDVMVQTLHGIGGVGKSQLAVEYAHGFANRYDLVWWIASGEPATIPDSYAKLAAELGLEPAPR
jgi:predicted ATPase